MPYRQPHPPSSTTRGVRVEWRFDPNPLTLCVLGPGLGTFLLVPAVHVLSRSPHETVGSISIAGAFVAYQMLVGLLVGLKHRLVPIEAPASVPVSMPAPRPKPREIALKDLAKALQEEVPVNSPEDF
jgi:hypothetical protein